jgi:HPr kinase/phosphorylase
MPHAPVPPSTDPVTVHASAVALEGRALLILGASGTGKSALALQLMAYGARLIADDGVVLTRDGDRLVAAAPDPIRGLVEARGLGLLNADPASPAPVALAADLDRTETDRLPPRRTTRVLGLDIDCVHKSDTPHFAAALMQYLRAGRRD